MTPAVFLRQRCRVCGKYRHADEFISGGAAAGFCLECASWHLHAIDILAGKTRPRGCQECGASFDLYAGREPGSTLSFFLHPKDGILQVLCRPCSDSYERKRLDLYGQTPYGHRRRLKGNK